MRSILCGKNGGAARPHKADDGSSEGELELSAAVGPPADERARHASTKDAIMSLFNQNLNFNNHASAPCPWPPQQR